MNRIKNSKVLRILKYNSFLYGLTNQDVILEDTLEFCKKNDNFFFLDLLL